MLGQLLNIVHQTIQLPLNVDFAPPAQRKSMQPLVISKIGEHGLDNGQSPPIVRATPGTVDAPLHPIGGGLGQQQVWTCAS